MEERDVLQHLLAVENEASSLGAQAQAEADRRVAERENAARAEYGERYGKRVAELDAEFERERERADAEYRNELDAYRAELERKRVDEGRFESLAVSLLFEDD